MAAASLVAASGAAYAADCAVPSLTYPKVQDAIADSSCATVNVAPGSYAESLTITHSVVLRGAQAGVPVGARTFGSAAESKLIGGATSEGVIKIQAANVTVDGFSITNPGTADNNRLGILVKTAGDNAVIQNNFIESIGGHGNMQLGGSHGIYLENGPDGVQVLGNAINAIFHSTRSSDGILIGDSATLNPSENVRIAGNTISNVVVGARGAYGILVNNGVAALVLTPSVHPANAQGAPGLQIVNNSITGLTSATGWVHAIGLEGNTPNVVVSGNTISNLTNPTPDNMAVWFEDNASFSTGQVNGNNYSGLIIGMASNTPTRFTQVDGTCNWWGNATGPSGVGPGSGVAVSPLPLSPAVAYAPWLLSPAPWGACGGGLAQKECHDAVEQAHKDFDAAQKSAKKAFDDQQKAARDAFNAVPHTPAEKKAFEDAQKAQNSAFDDQQKAAKTAFEAQNKADDAICKAS